MNRANYIKTLINKLERAVTRNNLTEQQFNELIKNKHAYGWISKQDRALIRSTYAKIRNYAVSKNK